jgi:tetratricopeptide (TPR) repeat protein
LFYAAIATIVACSTKKHTFTHRVYHNLTSHYNAYFNGNESLKEGIATIEKAHVDNYDKILPVFKYGTENDAKAIYPQMDRAIQKASVVIQRHSIFIKNVEYCNWIDDSYMLMGKADFYKRDYYPAIEIFEFVIKQYKDEPIRFEAMVWLARCYIELKRFSDAQNIFNILDETKNKSKIPEKLKKDINATIADFQIKISNSSGAIEPLAAAISETRKKKVRARYTFILAQLLEKAEDNEKSFQLYNRVLKMNPAYEMEFNTKINLARLTNVNSQHGEEVKKQLLKMTKDRKNKDYFDKIYFVLADISLKEKNIPQAIEYLKLSAKLSTTNTSQKALSFLKLAELTFQQMNYEESQMYYDSTVAFITKDYPGYENILFLKNTLTDLVQNIKTVQLEDSVQKLSRMTPKQIEDVINKIIQKIIDEEEAKRQADLLQQQNIAMNSNFSGNSNNPANMNTAPAANQWYFYNPSAISFGSNEFIKKWGNRKLEDNWRRANKESVMEFETDTSQAAKDTSSIKNAPVNLKDKNYYLKNIPFTAEQIKKSNEKLVEAFYALGVIYKEKLNDYNKSVESFTELLKRFPECKYELNSYYYLYRDYTELNEQPKVTYYKNLILTKFPNSDFAAIIKDPNYKRASEETNSKVAGFYKETYEAFTNGLYFKVIENQKTFDSLYKNSEYAPKFAYLKAISIGKTQDTASFKSALTYVIKNYANSEVAKLAQRVLDYCNGKTTAASGNTNTSANDSLLKKYIYEPQAIHIYAAIIPIMKADINVIKDSLANFNAKYFGLEKLQINNIYITDKEQIITVTNFKDKDRGMNYFKTVVLNENKIFGKLQDNQYKHFVISDKNYPVLYRDKSIDLYLLFFGEKYLK